MSTPAWALARVSALVIVVPHSVFLLRAKMRAPVVFRRSAFRGYGGASATATTACNALHGRCNPLHDTCNVLRAVARVRAGASWHTTCNGDRVRPRRVARARHATYTHVGADCHVDERRHRRRGLETRPMATDREKRHGCPRHRTYTHRRDNMRWIHVPQPWWRGCHVESIPTFHAE